MERENQSNGSNGSLRDSVRIETNSTSSTKKKLTEDYALIDFKQIAISLWQGKWLIVLCFVIVSVTGYYYTKALPDQYQASGIFLLETQRADRGISLFEFTRARSLTWNEVGAEIQFITNSTDLGERVGKKLIMNPLNPATGDTLPVLLRAGYGNRSDDQVVQRLGRMLPGMISLSQISEMNLVRVTSRSTDRHEVARVVNYYIESYSEIDQEITRANLARTQDYLLELESERYDEISRLEAEVTEFLGDDWTLITDRDGTRVASRIQSLLERIDFAEFEINIQERFISSLKEEKSEIIDLIAKGERSGVGRWLEILDNEILSLELKAEQYFLERPELRENPSMNDELSAILERRDALANRRRDYSEIYVENVRSQQGLNEISLTDYVMTLRMEIKREEASLQNKVANLSFDKQRVQSLQSEFLPLMNRITTLTRLDRDKNMQENLYQSLLRRLQETQIATRSEMGRVRKIREAFVPGSPTGPNKQRNYLLSMLVGFGLGVSLVFLRLYLDDFIHDPDQLSKKGFNTIGTIPDLDAYSKMHYKDATTIPVKKLNVNVKMITLIDSLAAGSEAFRRLRSNIEYSAVDTPQKLITITSSKPEEGKSLISSNLAVTFSQYGQKTLLIDADLRKPVIHKMFGLNRSPGLSEIVFDKVNLQDAVTKIEIPNLDILTSGIQIPDPVDIMGSKKFRNLINEFQKAYDIIILDTPPIQVVSDVLPLAVLSDGVILIARADKTEFELIKQSRADLEDIGAKVLGTVLNGFDFSKNNPYYKYNYNYKYKHAYKDYRLEYKENV